MQEIAEKIKNLRLEAGLSKLEFAKILSPNSSVSNSALISKITRIEECNQEITINELDCISKKFNIDICSFFNSENIVTNKNTCNKEISSLIKLVLKEYVAVKDKAFSKNSIGNYLRKEIPLLIEEKLQISNSYKVLGSAGIGQWAEVPWIVICNNEITETATNGIFIAILFRADMEGFYISLNQGWTYYRDTYGRKLGRENIKLVSLKLREYIITIIKNYNYTNKISLHANGNLGRGYEYGSIVAEYFSCSSEFTDIEVINSLKRFIEIYTHINSAIARRSFNEFVTDILHIDNNYFLDIGEDDIRYKMYINSVKGQVMREMKDIPTAITESIKIRNGDALWGRCGDIALNAIANAKYSCEFDNTHKSFVSRKNQKQYCEAHHLIPLSEQGNIEIQYSLDVEANIICLCDTCRNTILFGSIEEREYILKKLYYQREERLANAGILVSLPLLLSYYRKKDIDKISISSANIDY